ncbi:glycine cleavage system protein GcvH [bacterium]|nr:glycine cleavage system protein GcvH [bacterium]
MSTVLENLKYSKEHEWLKIEDGVATVGITDHAQSELGDIVFVELPEVGDTFDKDDSFGTVEAVKTVAELYSPISGEIIAINEELEDEAETVNSSPYENGWIIKIKISDESELESLLDAEAYKALIA